MKPEFLMRSHLRSQCSFDRVLLDSEWMSPEAQCIMLNRRDVMSPNPVGISLPVSVQCGLDCHLQWTGLHPPKTLRLERGMPVCRASCCREGSGERPTRTRQTGDWCRNQQPPFEERNCRLARSLHTSSRNVVIIHAEMR